MKIGKAVKPISYVKANAADIVREIAETHEPVIVTQNGEAKVIIQSLEEYEQLQESLAMLKILALGKASVAKGKSKPARKVFADVRKKAKAKNRHG